MYIVTGVYACSFATRRYFSGGAAIWLGHFHAAERHCDICTRDVAKILRVFVSSPVVCRTIA